MSAFDVLDAHFLDDFFGEETRCEGSTQDEGELLIQATDSHFFEVTDDDTAAARGLVRFPRQKSPLDRLPGDTWIQRLLLIFVQ